MISSWLGLTVKHDGVPYFKTINCSADQQTAPVFEDQMWCWRPEGHTTMASNAITEELHGWVRILPTHRPVAECCQRKKIKKQPRTDQSAENFRVNGDIKKAQLSETTLQTWCHACHTQPWKELSTPKAQAGGAQVFFLKGNAFYHNSPHLRLQIMSSSVFLPTQLNKNAFYKEIHSLWRYRSEKMQLPISSVFRGSLAIPN